MYEQDSNNTLWWFARSCGFLYGPLLLATGIAVFISACIVVLHVRRRTVTAAYFSLVPLPAIIGVIGTIHGIMQCFVNVHYNDPVDMEILIGFAISLVTTLVGLMFTVPSYLLTSLGWIHQASKEAQAEEPAPKIDDHLERVHS